VGNDKLFLDWIQADYLYRDWLGIRAGKMKIPFGLYNETRDIDSLRTEILLPQGVYMEYTRETFNAMLGVSLYGYLSCSEFGGVSYLVQYGERQMEEDNGDMSRLLADRGMLVDDFDMDPSFAGSLIWDTPLDGLRLGATYSFNQYDIEGTLPSPMGTSAFLAPVKDEDIWVVSIEYTVGRLQLTSELMDGGFHAGFDYTAPTVPDLGFRQSYTGYYVRGTYQWLDWLSTATGYSRFKTDQVVTVNPGTPASSSPRTTEEDQDDIFISLRFDVGDHIVLKAEHHFLAGDAGVFDSENPDGTDEHWQMSGFKASYLF
jgi:hypothetical protein